MEGDLFIIEVISSLSLGVGIDYCIHVTERYREEKSKNPVLPAANKDSVQIGTWAGEAWPGSVDEVRLWSRALSDAEMKLSMQLGAKEFATAVEAKNKLAVTWSQIKLNQ